MCEEKRKSAVFYDYRYHIGILYALTFLLHFPKLNVEVIGIDTEALIWNSRGVYDSWLMTGRQGLVFLKKIFGVMDYNPYFAAVMTLLTIPAAVSAFFILWDRVRGERSGVWLWALGGLLWISHPVLTEQLYFSLQSFEVSLALLLTAAALACAEAWAENGKRLICFCAGAALLILTFSVYQAMVSFYIFGVTAVTFLRAAAALNDDTEEGFSALLRRIGRHLTVFFAALFVNTVVTAVFFSGSSYLARQVSWGTVPIGTSVLRILRHMKQTLFSNNSQFYSFFYGVLVLFSLTLTAANIRKHREKSRGFRICVGLLWASLQTTPFLMTILQGGEPVLRSQLVLPAMMALQVFGIIVLIKALRLSAAVSGRAALIAAAAIGLLGGIRSARITWGFYYADQMRYEQDKALGLAVIDRIRKVCGAEDGTFPVVVVGHCYALENSGAAGMGGQMMGTASFFCWDVEAEPIPYFSTNRILGFLHTLGAGFVPAPPERMQEALAASTGMPIWPAEESVQIKDGMVIVRLSED